MSKFNEVIREYIKEQSSAVMVNPTSLQKIPNANTNTDALGQLLADAGNMMSKSGTFNPEQAGEFQKLLKQDGTYKDVSDYLKKYPTLIQPFQKMGLYTPTTNPQQSEEDKEKNNNPVTNPSNATNTSPVKSPSPWSNTAPKA